MNLDITFDDFKRPVDFTKHNRKLRRRYKQARGDNEANQADVDQCITECIYEYMDCIGDDVLHEDVPKGFVGFGG